jgi:hypothetical protein
MAVTNTKFKITDRTRRIPRNQLFKDHETQPRLLQPVAAATDVTVANGFVATDLRPGDLMFVVAGASSGNPPELWTRNGANGGWHVLIRDSGEDVSD